jgi:hypothetical protein
MLSVSKHKCSVYIKINFSFHLLGYTPNFTVVVAAGVSISYNK